MTRLDEQEVAVLLWVIAVLVVAAGAGAIVYVF